MEGLVGPDDVDAFPTMERKTDKIPFSNVQKLLDSGYLTKLFDND